MLSSRRAKIVCTIGPALATKDHLKKAIECGMNVARLNFSHGTHDDHARNIKDIRSLSRELNASIAIMQDLQGPKIRVGRFANGKIDISEGEKILLSSLLKKGEPGKVPIDFPGLHEVCENGTKIFIDDGLLELKVTEVRGTDVFCEVLFGGELKDRKGVNIPGANLPVEFMTDKDKKDLEFGLSHKVDYVAMSFVRRGSDIKELRSIINKKSPETRIVAKIEMLEALENLEDIVMLSDAVMVARGDLAVEVGQSHLPLAQKNIIALCNEFDTPVITATQMLDSMVVNPRPTRAEITDVANAVIDGSDALMLSAETASGDNPFKCISTMHEIIKEVEAGQAFTYYDINVNDEFEVSNPQALAASASLTAMKVQAEAIVCLTTTGKTATLISSFRPRARIFAMTKIEHTLSRLELPWGIQTFRVEEYQTADEVIDQIQDNLVRYGLVKNGDKIVVTLGVPVKSGVKTNSIIVHTIDSSERRDRPENIPLRCR